MQRPTTHSMALLAAVLAAALSTASCAAGSTTTVRLPGQGSAPGPGTSPATSRPPSRSAPATPLPSSPAASVSPAAHTAPHPPLPPSPPAGCDAEPWRTAPVQVTRHLAVPPVPIVTAIRIGTHPDCGYDRIVVDFRGPMPGYDIRYVSRVATGSSGTAVTVPGHSYLLITIHPAQGHSLSGVSTISPLSAATTYPMLRGYAVTGDFEGVVSIAVGLERATAFRVGRLPGRLYVDVAG